MEIGISTAIAAFLTLCIFSFLYKDNPFYTMAEHIVVGVSAGYFTVLLFRTTVKDNLWDPLYIDHKWIFLIPGLLGLLMLTRFIPKYSWLSRYAIAVYLGGAGMSVPLYLRSHVIRQVHASLKDPIGKELGDGGFTWLALITSLIVFFGVICGLAYFFFSKPHTGIIGGMAKVGILILMAGFGATFGFTVMSRISLLIGRMQFLIYDAIVPFWKYIGS